MHGYNYARIGIYRDGVRKFNGTTRNGITYNKYTAAVSSRRRGGKVKYWQWQINTYRRQNYVSSVLKPNS
jgi:hypothetical protein